ncbi:type ISP restriction/modification enzyme [Sphingopyxis sp. FD7]|jgi:hypothetical protein|uniref:type ISP restriction/modification enzyme n=1 Tax=Sphingopyxis sp. FD7 TaxID=1914525 RepID=UPI001558C844|nr:type ISP restriction/modification enzyme [Sphingopyxis sp. FD7]
MPVNSVGIVTARDALTIDMDRETLWERVRDMKLSDPEELRQRYALGADVRDWRVEWAKADITRHFGQTYLKQIAYRPFDMRWTYYTGNSRGFICYPRDEVMRHLAEHENLALMVPKQTKDELGGLVNDGIAGHKAFSGFDITSNFPLYFYPDNATEQRDAFAPKQRTLNFDPKLYAAICAAAGIDPADTAMSRDADGPHPNPSPEGEGLYDFRAATGDARPSEVKVFDYIYGVLHSPAYRETFAEFLKIDFPRIPYPHSPEVFRHVSEKGEALRRLHLMEAGAIGATPYPYHGEGDDVVASGFPKFEKSSPSLRDREGDHAEHGGGASGAKAPPPPSAVPLPTASPQGGSTGRVFINRDQYFDGVPEIAWTFRIGGYQPAQKWLKDRRGRALSWDDIGHYQKIVKILIETDRIMREIALPLD